MRITIKDLASMCGVSAGTVDRALNNRKGISEKTRKKILRVAKEMDYRPDYTARSLVMGKTMTLGVVLFDLYNRSFAQLMNAIETRARELGYFVYLTLTAKNPENEVKCIDNLVNRKVDGIILLTVNKGEAFEAYLERLRIPLVTIFNFISDRWEHIGIQERNAMKGAIDYIVSKQYHNYIYVSPPLAYIDQSNIYTQEERLNGFLEGLEANRIDRPTEIIRDKDYVTVLEQTRFSENEKTAIVCSCDLYALEVINLFKKKGLHIPSQIGIMGFDDIDMLKYVSPRLSTVKYPIDEMGIQAVESLVHKINDNSDKSVPLLEYEIVEGESI